MGDIFKPHGRAVAISHNHGPIVGRAHQLAVGLNVVGGLVAVERAGGSVDVPILDGGIDLIEADLTGGEAIGIYLYAHGVLGGSEDLHLGHAGDHGDALGDHGFGVLVEIGQAHGGRGDEEADDGLIAGIDLMERGRRGHAGREQRE